MYMNCHKYINKPKEKSYLKYFVIALGNRTILISVKVHTFDEKYV